MAMIQSIVYVILFSFLFPETSVAKCYYLEIMVSDYKVNGRQWDGIGGKERGIYAPDIRANVDGQTIGCQDSFVCTDAEFMTARRRLSVSIVDKDAISDDAIGSGSCPAPTERCRIGQAIVRITEC